MCLLSHNSYHQGVKLLNSGGRLCWANMATVFVYGTLQFPQVLQQLINRSPKTASATLKHYQRHAIRGQVFPGTIPGPADSQVRGLVLFDLTPEEVEVFDEFEGEEYYKTRVRPVLDDGSEVEADIYLWQDRLRPLLYGTWDEEAFKEQHLPSYVKMCGRFAEQLRR